MIARYVVCVWVCLVCGCGTVVNFGLPCACGSPNAPEPYRIYGGVRNDVELLASIKRPNALVVAVTPIVLLDIPVSFVGDTLTLPLVLAFQHGSSVHRRSTESTTSVTDELESWDRARDGVDDPFSEENESRPSPLNPDTQTHSDSAPANNMI
jgi:uncharacterized protein YceK